MGMDIIPWPVYHSVFNKGEDMKTEYDYEEIDWSLGLLRILNGWGDICGSRGGKPIVVEGNRFVYGDGKDKGLVLLASVNSFDHFYIRTEKKRVFDIKKYDRVLVRDHKTERWRTSLYYGTNENKAMHCFECNDFKWNQVAKFEGNEDKIGTDRDIEDKWTREDLND